MQKKHNRKAFSMIELIFVIVIMGMIGKFGVEFLAQAYESFIFSKINNDLQSRSSSAVEFIAKRLEHRIKKSTIARNVTGGTPGTWNYVEGGLGDDNATVLEWIGADIDGFRGIASSVGAVPYTPNWSGIIDLNSSSAARLISPATNLNRTNQTISTLSYGASTVNDAAIYLLDSLYTINSWGYDKVGVTDQNRTIRPIRSVVNVNEIWPSNTVPSTNFAGRDISEYYKLTWTAYAIELRDYNTTTKVGNLWLYYDYQPWQAEEYYDNGVKSALIAENISAFRFRAAGSLIKIQVCAKSLLTGEEYAVCKEKTVY